MLQQAVCLFHANRMKPDNIQGGWQADLYCNSDSFQTFSPLDAAFRSTHRPAKRKVPVLSSEKSESIGPPPQAFESMQESTAASA